jgi:hypothetical protein
VEVTAESLYEAVAQALGILRGDQWVEEIGEGLTELRVRVKQPAVEHRVRMKDFRRWLEPQGRTPVECTRNRKLLALAKGRGRGGDPGKRRGTSRLHRVGGASARRLMPGAASNKSIAVTLPVSSTLYLHGGSYLV